MREKERIASQSVIRPPSTPKWGLASQTWRRLLLIGRRHRRAAPGPLTAPSPQRRPVIVVGRQIAPLRGGRGLLPAPGGARWRRLHTRGVFVTGRWRRAGPLTWTSILLFMVCSFFTPNIVKSPTYTLTWTFFDVLTLI